MRLIKIPVEKSHWLFGSNYRETNCKFNKPTSKRRYIKILETCLTPSKASDIYPNVKNPLMEQVRDMCREGLLDRLTDGKVYYYKTTAKGLSLMMEAK